MQQHRQKQGGTEMNDGGTAKSSASLSHSFCRPVGNQREDDELQSDQRAGRRSDDDVEVVPSGEFCHGFASAFLRYLSYLVGSTACSMRLRIVLSADSLL